MEKIILTQKVLDYSVEISFGNHIGGNIIEVENVNYEFDGTVIDCKYITDKIQSAMSYKHGIVLKMIEPDKAPSLQILQMDEYDGHEWVYFYKEDIIRLKEFLNKNF